MKLLKKEDALKIIEPAYLASLSALLWIALYYLPIGGALVRLILPLPLVLLQLRRGTNAAFEGLIIQILLLFVLMGPVRGTLFLFPYGVLAFWLGWCWLSKKSWWFSWTLGFVFGSLGFFIRVISLSILVGDNLWIIITKASYGLLEKISALLNFSYSPSLLTIQLVAILLIIFQEMVYVLTLHVIAYAVFPRLKSVVPDPPSILEGFVRIDI